MCQLGSLTNWIYWTVFQSTKMSVLIAATDKGLCYVGAANAELDEWAKKKLPTYQIIENEEMMRPYISTLVAYFEGDSTSFSVPLDLQGTSFQQQVWAKLLAIPYGETVSYSTIAESMGKPKAVRAVATAIAANPVVIVIPCHRVVGKNGKLTGYRGGLEMKRALLTLENNNWIEQR